MVQILLFRVKSAMFSSSELECCRTTKYMTERSQVVYYNSYLVIFKSSFQISIIILCLWCVLYSMIGLISDTHTSNIGICSAYLSPLHGELLQEET